MPSTPRFIVLLSIAVAALIGFVAACFKYDLSLTNLLLVVVLIPVSVLLISAISVRVVFWLSPDNSQPVGDESSDPQTQGINPVMGLTTTKN